MKLLTGLRALIVLAGLTAVACAQAYTITVTTGADEDLLAGAGCSLREALQLRFNDDGVAYNGCTVSGGFVAGAAVTINFNADYLSGSPVRGSALPIAATSAGSSALGNLTIDGSGHSVHIACGLQMDNKIFVESNNANFTLTNVLMDGCTVPGSGIAIDNNAGGRLTIANVTFDNFHSNNGGNGGAVAHSGGILTITNSQFTNNGTSDTTPTPDLGSGGALYIGSISGATPSSLDNVTFTSNTAGRNGGAIFYNNSSTPPYSLLITNSTFTTNTADGHVSNIAGLGGGAIYESELVPGAAGIFLIGNSLFTGNTASNGSGGAILVGTSSRLAYSSASNPETGGIYGCHFTGNSTSGAFSTADSFGGMGGAIYSRGYITVTQSSFVSNASNGASGGAIAHAGDGSATTSVIANTTFYNNTSHENGGAIANIASNSTLQLLNNTIANNSASGIMNASGAPHPGGGAIYNANAAASSVAASNTIFGASGGAGGNCAGTVPQNVANNLQYSPTVGCGGMTAGDPLLLAPAVNAPASGVAVTPLARTMAIGEGSPASRGGDVATCAAAPVNSTDATGSVGVRPTPALTSCDIGAYESGSLTPVDLQSFSVE